MNILKREPDELGLNHFLNLMKNNQLDENGLEEVLKNSEECKYLHIIRLDRDGLEVREWMKRDWNKRAEINPKFFIGLESPDEGAFWQNGIDNVNSIRDSLFKNKNTKKMKALEIGCGIGRILIPMSKIFGEVVGVDISSVMIGMCRRNIQNIENCKVFENDGSDLSTLSDNYFDFCYAHTVFQHIPEKGIVINYIKETSRVLKPAGLFRFNVIGDIAQELKNPYPNTQSGVTFTPEEMHDIVKENNFQILDECGHNSIQYTLTLKRI